VGDSVGAEDGEGRKENNLSSVDELEHQGREERRQKILNDPFVKEAEKIFNSKVDKIILND
jgi:hypothetical protein